MTSCGDEGLPLATSHWPTMKLNDNVPTLNQMQTTAFEPASEAEGNTGTTDALVNAAVLRQRLELYWSQVLQCQQQKALAERERETHVSPPVNGNAPTFQIDPLAEARNLMQRLMSERATGLPTDGQVPPSNLVPGSKAAPTYPTYSSKLPTNFGTELGNLLPPPPMLPSSLAPPHPMLTNPTPSPTTVQSSTSTTPLDLSKVPTHDFPTIPVATSASLIQSPAQDERRSDAMQPLDLSTSTNKRQHSDDRTTILPDKPVLQSTPQRKQIEPNYLASSSTAMIPPISAAVPSYTRALAANPAFSALNAQQLLALGPYFQNVRPQFPYPKNGRQQQPQPQPQYPVASGIGQDYLQKWIHAAQQRQQATAVSQPAAKKSRTEEYHAAAQMQFHRMNGPTKKDLFLGNNMHSPQQHQMPANPNPSPNHPATGAPANNSTRGSGKRYKRYAKPPYSYVSLITLSILSSPEKKLRLSQILKRISEMFPFFNGSYQGWRDSVRHNLSQNECFVKVLKNPYRPTAKGNYWTVNVTAIPHELLLRQNTLVSRYAQDSGFRYRKDLTEVFDLVNGNLKVGIPHYLFDGTDLVDDPASVMEALLLEEKTDDDSSHPLPLNSRVYSLEDMFNQDDFLEEDMLRQHQHHNNGGRWSNKAAKRANTQSKSLAAAAALPTRVTTSTPSPASFQHYINSIESQKMALQMMQNPNPTVAPANPQMLTQQEILSKALSGQMPNLGCLPLLQNYYAKNQTQTVEAPQNNVAPKPSEISPVLSQPSDIVVRQAKSASPQPVVVNKMESSVVEEQVNDVGNWNQNNAKRNRRKGVQPMRRFSSNESSVKAEFTASPCATSTVDSGIVGSLSPRSPTRSFCSSEPGDVSGVGLVIDQASPVRSQSSDVSAETMASSPRDDTDEMIVSPRGYAAPPFSMFGARPMETGKTM
uniref:Uncharacterized protein LOC778613 n=1 Tax=Phallusia mammillata TaxID=59560 RepID=A0A6F9DJI2_9ASCI|nr:uncharacterized protein LOC778613 [Phallusia mammillata]